MSCGTGGTGSSGARYADMSASGVSFQMTPQMYYARTEAVRLGVPWVGNTPELLRLGTPAVKAIAATNLKETGYKALREGAHYQAQDVVTFAKHAKIRGFDAEQAAHATRDLVQAQPNAQQQGLSQVLITFDRAMVAAHERPNDPAAQAQLQAAGLEQKTKLQAIAAQSSEQEARVRLIEDAKKVPEPFRATTAANIAAAVKVDAVNTVQSAKLDTTIAVTDATVAQRAATKAQVDDAFAAGPDKPASAAVPAPTAGKPVVVAAAPVDKTPSAAPAAQPVAAKPPAPK